MYTNMTYHVLVLFIVMYYYDELLMLKSNKIFVLFCIHHAHNEKKST